jgi:hypothetical protein
MIHFLFPRRHFSEAERRLIRLEGPKPAEPEKTDKPKEESKKSPESKEKTKKGADGKPEVKDATEAAKNKATEKLAKLQSDVQKNMTTFYKNVLLPQYKANEAKMTPEQKAAYPAKFAHDIQADLNAMNTNLEFSVTMEKDAKGADYPKVTVKPRVAPAPGPDAAKPEVAKDDGTYKDALKKGVNKSLTDMHNAKDKWEAMGHFLYAAAQMMAGLDLAMQGKLLKQTPENEVKQQRRARLLGEAKKEGDDTMPMTAKLEKLKVKKDADLKTAKGVVDGSDAQLKNFAKATADAKTGLEVAQKPVPPAKEPDAALVKKAQEQLEKATKAETEAKKLVETAKKEVVELTLDLATLTETQEDVKKMTDTIGKIIDGFNKANPAMAGKLGTFTVTPEGLLIDGPEKLADGSAPLLVQLFPKQFKDKKVVTLADLEELTKKPKAPAAGGAEKPPEAGPKDPPLEPNFANTQIILLKGAGAKGPSDGMVVLTVTELNKPAIRKQLQDPTRAKTLDGLRQTLEKIVSGAQKNSDNAEFSANTKNKCKEFLTALKTKEA